MSVQTQVVNELPDGDALETYGFFYVRKVKDVIGRFPGLWVVVLHD